MNLETNNRLGRPKIGLALSGGSGRALAQAGVLEVFEENGIPIDVITAYSSGSLIAAAYACGTLNRLRDDWLKMNTGTVFRMFELNDKTGGLFGMNKFKKWFTEYCDDKKFEELSLKLGFVAVDLKTKEQVLLCLGDIERALEASCAVPGLFEPVPWGNRLLVDGGLMSFIPAAEARSLGADVVVGVNVLHRKTMFTKRTLDLWRLYNKVKNSAWIEPARYARRLATRVYKNFVRDLFSNSSVGFEPQVLDKPPHVFLVLKQAMDIAVSQDLNLRKALGCDILLRPQKIYHDQIGVQQLENIYQEGRRVALEAVPKIKEMMQHYAQR